MIRPTITVARKSGSAAALKRVFGMSKLAAYVGIPAANTRARSEQLLEMAGKVKGVHRRAKLQKAAQSDVNNAELLFIFSKGSPLRRQPARPVLEPSVQAEKNKRKIVPELAASAKAHLAGDEKLAVKRMKRAALAGQNAARSWFTDAENGWASLAESTKRARMRGRSKKQVAAITNPDGTLSNSAFTPGVDTGAMRAAIQGVVGEE